MTMAGRVSVIVPFLNAKRFIGEAIESVLAQTYGNWELLLVDDGSADGSTEIAREYTARDPARVIRLNYPDGRTRGPAAARNLGIASAKGAYLAFLDADDVWQPQKLERQVRMLESQPEVGMVYGTSQWWYSWDQKAEDPERDYVEQLGVPDGVVIEPPSLLRPCFVLQEASIPNPTSVLVRRWVIDRVGGFEESVPDGHEDQTFFAKVCVDAPILASNECWDRYRQHPRSLTADQRSRGEEAAARCLFLTWLISYLSDRAVDRQICAALRRQRFRYAHPRVDWFARQIARGA